ncbi:WD repeat-containing protein 87-like [Engraulis encrasicolus]|uniref:WD repeat-containing protein 87-like n=1 Tax=Engraulis encrasicolus TaxID=184585 RepID=UPI002FD57F63
MPINLRVIPEWTDFAPRLVKAIQQREQQSDGFNQTDKEETLLTNVHPNIQFHYSCAPLHHFHCITSYSGCGANVVLGFKWGQTELDHQIVTWVNDGQGNLRLHSTVPVYGRYKIELMLFIPSRGMLVGYCNDMWLRILTDKTQEMVVLFQSKCPFLVASMHYCPETSILLTGSMGLIALWDLNPFTQSPLSLLRTLDWTNSSLRRDAVITAFVPQCQTNSFYALCHRQVKSFENTGVKEQFEFRGQSVATLRCAVTEWRQRYLYTGDAEGYMQVWSYDTRRLFLQFRAHADAVTSLVLLSESGTVLSSSTGCWIKQWTRSGDLLLKLHTDMTGGVRSMWKLGKNVVLCQSSNSLDVWHLNSVYRSFNDTACSVRVLQRLDCGVGGKARVLAVTQEGIMRFFSPVSGELLFLSWPFLHIDKALGFAYDPVREELFICDGSVDVLVLNTTLNPCPVKHIINTVKDGYDGVMCLASVLLRRLQDQAGCGSPLCLVFSGHCNGKLQLLAPLGLTCRPKQAHIGAICQMTSSDAGETPLICCFGTDNEFTLWSVSFGEHHVNLIPHYRITCNFTPVHCKVLKGFICAISPEQNLVLYSLNGEKKPTVVERKKSERISCLDYCPQLDTIAVSGDSGKVEIWNPRGDLVAEIQLGVPVTQVCFGNTRGDILASFSDSINIMSVTHILPPSYLRSVLRQAPADEIIEVPIPFVPKSPSHYDISLVAKMYLKHDEKESLKALQQQSQKMSQVNWMDWKFQGKHSHEQKHYKTPSFLSSDP